MPQKPERVQNLTMIGDLMDLNKRLKSNKRAMEAYKFQDGDLYCDASHAKEGVTNFIACDKTFIHVIRMVAGKWTLIGIGG